METPRIQIDLAKIAHNVKKMVDLYAAKGISVIGVTKGVCGDPRIAKIFLQNGIDIIGDSRISNFKRMREEGIRAPFLLLRLPCLSEVEALVKYADMSLNSEVGVIKEISKTAKKNNKQHKVILMVELGDLREGIMPSDMENTVQEIKDLKGIKFSGIGTNLACFGGVKPDEEKMNQLSSIAQSIEDKFNLSLDFISGGNTANYYWIQSTKEVGKINNVRLGESMLLGGISLDGKGIPGLYSDAFRLVAEVIESKIKPSKPYGEIGLDAFGNVPEFEDRGPMKRVLLAVGRQDILVSGLDPKIDVEILGASSDHLILNAHQTDFKVGDQVEFNLNRGAMLAAMTSPYVTKKYINGRSVSPCDFEDSQAS
ncbi:MAG: alanine/ornithine racemase family PLP-dependent enzyme [Candidatus Aminicenantes bacterium]